jgi:hypothetical protein
LHGWPTVALPVSIVVRPPAFVAGGRFVLGDLSSHFDGNRSLLTCRET